MDQQVSNSFDFQVRDMIGSPRQSRLSGDAKVHSIAKLSKFKLPDATGTLSINSATTPAVDRDWDFNSVYRDPVLYALREPPLPSPDAGKVFSFKRCDSRLQSAVVKQSYNPVHLAHPRSPRVSTSTQDVARKYTVTDLNELLVSADGAAVPLWFDRFFWRIQCNIYIIHHNWDLSTNSIYAYDVVFIPSFVLRHDVPGRENVLGILSQI